MNNDERIAKINKKITLFSVLDLPGVVAVGVGLYSKYGSEGRELHPLLSDAVVVNSLLVAGGTVMLFCAVNVVRLHREKSRIVNQ